MRRAMIASGVLCVFALSVGLGVLAADGLRIVEIQVSPGTLVLSSQGNWVTVHADIPYSTVKEGSVTLNGVPAHHTFYDDCGDLVAKFLIDDIKDIVKPPSATLELRGLTVDGVAFGGTDTIRVVRGASR